MEKIRISKNLRQLAKRFYKPLYIVGGYVRNSLLGQCCYDVDICSSLTYDEVEFLLKNTKFKIKAKSKKLGTMYIFCGKEKYEYTTFRIEKYDETGSHKPIQVAFTNDLEKDALRRDFTINAIYYDIVNKKIIDPFHAIEDLENKTIKEITNKNLLINTSVFIDDGLRILRLIRFAGELGFSVDDQTLSNAIKYVDRLNDIFPERKKEELLKILNCENKYPNIKISKQIMAYKKDVDEKEENKPDVRERIVHYFKCHYKSNNKLKYALELFNKLKILKYFGLRILEVNYQYVYQYGLFGFLIDLANCTDLNINEFVEFLKEYQFSNKQDINSLLSAYLHLKENAEMETVIKYYNDISKIDCYLKDLNHYDVIQKNYKEIKKKHIPITLKDLLISGNDILKVAPSFEREKIGVMLNSLLQECQTLKLKNKRKILLERIKNVTFSKE